MGNFPTIPGKPGAFQLKPQVKRAAILRPADIRHVLRVIEATSRWPERDAALIHVSACVGMRCTEMARVTTMDLLYPDGRIRQEVLLRAAITKGSLPRMSYWTHPRLIAAMERYIRDRQERGIGNSRKPDYAGLGTAR